jgi:DNA modification methylase
MPSTVMASRVEHWPLANLIPYARNARTHSDQQVAEIARSIREFGFNAPILVDSHAGIIAGHGRLLAARQLELAEVPVIVLDHLSEEQKRAYMLADNRLALSAGWDPEMLSAEIAALREAHFDLGLIGFAPDELAALAAESSGVPQADEDAAPEPLANTITVPGDLWIMRNHRLLCGDACLPESYQTLLGDNASHLVFTDPPYACSYIGKSARQLRIQNDNLGDGFGRLLRQACEQLLKFNQGAVYICMSSAELDTLKREFQAAGGHWSTFVIWAKNTFTLGRSDYQRQYEPLLYGWREGGRHYWCGARNEGDVWFVDKPLRNDVHPTMKPVELVERALCNSSRAGDTVLDPFAGSGSTLIACEKTRRSARLMEIDPVYCDVIVRRWQQYSGERATHVADGRTFDAVPGQRSIARQEPPEKKVRRSGGNAQRVKHG